MMSKYKLGKDMGNVIARVKQLEKKCNPCNCGEGKTGNQSAISSDELLENLHSAAPDEKTFKILSHLVLDAGHITIRDLFSKTSGDVGTAASLAILNAKKIGFIALSNDQCCYEVDDPFEDDYCKVQSGKWCSRVKKTTKFMCTLASDKC